MRVLAWVIRSGIAITGVVLLVLAFAIFKNIGAWHAVGARRLFARIRTRAAGVSNLACTSRPSVISVRRGAVNPYRPDFYPDVVTDPLFDPGDADELLARLRTIDSELADLRRQQDESVLRGMRAGTGFGAAFEFLEQDGRRTKRRSLVDERAALMERLQHIEGEPGPSKQPD